AGEEPVVRGGREQELGERPLHGEEDGEEGGAEQQREQPVAAGEAAQQQVHHGRGREQQQREVEREHAVDLAEDRAEQRLAGEQRQDPVDREPERGVDGGDGGDRPAQGGGARAREQEE